MALPISPFQQSNNVSSTIHAGHFTARMWACRKTATALTPRTRPRVASMPRPLRKATTAPALHRPHATIQPNACPYFNAMIQKRRGFIAVMMPGAWPWRIKPTARKRQTTCSTTGGWHSLRPHVGVSDNTGPPTCIANAHGGLSGKCRFASQNGLFYTLIRPVWHGITVRFGKPPATPRRHGRPVGTIRGHKS